MSPKPKPTSFGDVLSALEVLRATPGAERDLIFHETIGNHPTYAKTDAQKWFYTWVATGYRLKLTLAANTRDDHPTLLAFFVLDGRPNNLRIRFPFNFGDSVPSDSLSPASVRAGTEHDADAGFTRL